MIYLKMKLKSVFRARFHTGTGYRDIQEVISDDVRRILNGTLTIKKPTIAKDFVSLGVLLDGHDFLGGFLWDSGPYLM